MHEGMISTGKVFAGVLWTWVGGLLVAAWFVALLAPGDIEFAALLAATACASSALAAVFHIRCFFVRQSHLIRASTDRICAGRDEGSPSRSSMRSVPPQHTR